MTTYTKFVQKVITTGEQIIQERTRGIVQERYSELATQLQTERSRVENHYEKESAVASDAKKYELEKFKSKEVEELEQRYEVKTEISLLSLQEIIVPLIQYNLSITKGKIPTAIAQPFTDRKSVV